MAKPKINWGILTGEETLALVKEGIEQLSSDDALHLADWLDEEGYISLG